MNTLEANIRDTKTKGELNSLRDNGEVPAIIYGGEAQNEKVSISKKLLKSMLEDSNFLSTILTLNVNGLTVQSPDSSCVLLASTSPNTEYSVALAFEIKLPLSILIISINLESSVDVVESLSSVKLIFNLCAPLAAQLDEPLELSVSEPSASGVTKVSVIVKPILAVSVEEFELSNNVCLFTFTNCPLI